MTDNKDKPNDGLQVNIPGEAIDKATAELIDKLAVKTVEGTVGLAGDIFGGSFGDAIKQWRQRNLFGSLAKTTDFLKERGVAIDDIRQLPMGEIYAAFYGASQEEEPAVQQLWAGLLANALDPESFTRADKLFTSILTNLSSDEALILDIVQKSEELDQEEYQYDAKARAEDPKGTATGETDQKKHVFRERDDALRKAVDDLGVDRTGIAMTMMMQKGLIYYSGNFLNEVSAENHAMEVRYAGPDRAYVVPEELVGLINSVADNINIMNNSEHSSEGAMQEMTLFARRNSFGSRFYDLSKIGRALLNACAS